MEFLKYVRTQKIYLYDNLFKSQISTKVTTALG